MIRAVFGQLVPGRAKNARFAPKIGADAQSKIRLRIRAHTFRSDAHAVADKTPARWMAGLARREGIQFARNWRFALTPVKYDVFTTLPARARAAAIRRLPAFAAASSRRRGRRICADAK